MEISKKSILKQLKQVCPGVKLPSEIDFRIYDNTLYLNVGRKGVIENMQYDSAAFEGWAICIKAAIPEIGHVAMSWDNPRYSKTTEIEGRQRKHYNRFLMRVNSFLDNYSWFSIAPSHDEDVNSIRELFESRCLLMNYPKSESKPVVDKEKKPEAFLEREMVKALREQVPLTDHQLPVGLFVNEVEAPNTFTPCKGSQIDIWQVEDTTLRVFELKATKNEKVGIISELMFYTNTMYYLKEGVIQYPDTIRNAKNYRHIKNLWEVIEAHLISKIDAIFMTGKLHTLFEAREEEILKILNNNKYLIRYRIERI